MTIRNRPMSHQLDRGLTIVLPVSPEINVAMRIERGTIRCLPLRKPILEEQESWT